MLFLRALRSADPPTFRFMTRPSPVAPSQTQSHPVKPSQTQSNHFTQNARGSGSARPAPGGFFVPQTSKSAVSRPALRDKPAARTRNWRVRYSDDPPMGPAQREAMPQVCPAQWEAVRFAKTPIKCRSGPAPHGRPFSPPCSGPVRALEPHPPASRGCNPGAGRLVLILNRFRRQFH
jgi:hypothetical protein